ncbi:hypothetical protein MMA97_26375, partial [Salmonella enterica]|nr:hypothetical protein [Salmonella enterica]
QSLPAALRLVDEAGPGSPAEDYVSIERLRSAIREAGSGPLGWRDPMVTYGVANGLLIARFVNWFSCGNGPNQDP